MKKSVKITLIILLSVVGVTLCSLLIGRLVYKFTHTKSEIRYTTGVVVDRDTYVTTTYITQKIGKYTHVSPVFTKNYLTKVRIDDSDITFTDSTYSTYNKYFIGDTVRVEIVDNYFEGEHIGTYYYIRPEELK